MTGWCALRVDSRCGRFIFISSGLKTQWPSRRSLRSRLTPWRPSTSICTRGLAKVSCYLEAYRSNSYVHLIFMRLDPIFISLDKNQALRNLWFRIEFSRLSQLAEILVTVVPNTVRQVYIEIRVPSVSIRGDPVPSKNLFASLNGVLSSSRLRSLQYIGILCRYRLAPELVDWRSRIDEWLPDVNKTILFAVDSATFEKPSYVLL